MKRVYEKPVMEVEGFEANEYVAACYDVSASCDIYSYDKDISDGSYDKYVIGEDKLWHGTACQNNTFVYNGDTLTGWEVSTGNTISNLQVSNGYGTWISYDKAGNKYYHHGPATMVENARPNHS